MPILNKIKSHPATTVSLAGSPPQYFCNAYRRFFGVPTFAAASSK